MPPGPRGNCIYFWRGKAKVCSSVCGADIPCCQPGQVNPVSRGWPCRRVTPSPFVSAPAVSLGDGGLAVQSPPLPNCWLRHRARGEMPSSWHSSSWAGASRLHFKLLPASDGLSSTTRCWLQRRIPGACGHAPASACEFAELQRPRERCKEIFPSQGTHMLVLQSWWVEVIPVKRITRLKTSGVSARARDCTG